MKRIFFSLIFLPWAATAQLTQGELDKLVKRTLETFEVPGIAVSIIKDGKVLSAKGYGVRSLDNKLPIDENTLFGIASNSKALTAAALGLLKEEGKLHWDSKVTDFIPEFKMYDPYVTAEFTIRDLLTHRSGLGLGAGDLMFWPDVNTFTRADIIHNLRFLKPVSSFRSKYDYDNLLYIVAGEIVERVSGRTWEDFIQERIFDPLEIKTAAPSFKKLKNKENVIDPHAVVEGKLQVVRRDWSENANAAGGIYASVTDMSKWVQCLLNKGKYGKSLEKQLISEQTLRELWTPQTLMSLGGPGPYNSNFLAYGLGWVVTDVKGYKQLSHTGGLLGIVTQTTLIPELNLGIIVYTNQQTGAAFNAITNTIKDSYLGVTGKDRVAEYHANVLKNRKEAQEIIDKVNLEVENALKGAAKPNFEVIGTYTDQWFGEVVVSEKNGGLWFESKKSGLLQGPMSYYKGNTYVVKWVDRSLDADAYLVFSLDREGQANGLKVSAISPLTDFSFDFQDLDFERKK